MGMGLIPYYKRLQEQLPQKNERRATRAVSWIVVPTYLGSRTAGAAVGSIFLALRGNRAFLPGKCLNFGSSGWGFTAAWSAADTLPFAVFAPGGKGCGLAQPCSSTCLPLMQ
jgi:hypothetical protein